MLAQQATLPLIFCLGALLHTRGNPAVRRTYSIGQNLARYLGLCQSGSITDAKTALVCDTFCQSLPFKWPEDRLAWAVVHFAICKLHQTHEKGQLIEVNLVNICFFTKWITGPLVAFSQLESGISMQAA